MISRWLLSAAVITTMSLGACSKTDAQDADAASDATDAMTEEQQAIAFSDNRGVIPTDPSAWRDVDQDNLLYINTTQGLIVVEFAPEFAPKHVEQIKTLAGQEFYDQIIFHRVIDEFMNQTGDPTGTGTGDSSLPDIPGEFTFRRDPSMAVSLLGRRPVNPRNPNAGAIDVGFYKGFPVATNPVQQAALTADGKVEAWGLHCSGVTSMARSADPNSANSQFFLMRGTAGWLDKQYSVWGNTVWGHENLTKFAIGTKGEDAGFVPDQMETVRLGSDLPEEEQLKIQVLKTEGPAWRLYLNGQQTPEGAYPDICDIRVPTRLAPDAE